MKRNKITVLALALFAVLMYCGCGKLSGEERLVKVGTWERLRDPDTTMTFYGDNTGYQYNMGYRYDFYWELEDGRLVVDLDGFWSIVYDVEFTKDGYIITNSETGTSASYVEGGSQEEGLPAAGKLDKKLIGVWISDDASMYAVSLSDNGTGYRYDPADSSGVHAVDFEWTVYKGRLYFEYEGGGGVVYDYKIKSGELTLLNLNTQIDYVYEKQK